MYKLLFFITLLLAGTSLEAGWWCCPRYYDLYRSSEEGLYYGYVDNLNYPDTYDLPLNCRFNYCPPCRAENFNCSYFKNCIEYSNKVIPPRN